MNRRDRILDSNLLQASKTENLWIYFYLIGSGLFWVGDIILTEPARQNSWQ